jgi:hypothetical protein
VQGDPLETCRITSLEPRPVVVCIAQRGQPDDLAVEARRCLDVLDDQDGLGESGAEHVHLLNVLRSSKRLMLPSSHRRSNKESNSCANTRQGA